MVIKTGWKENFKSLEGTDWRENDEGQLIGPGSGDKTLNDSCTGL
jgi:hypothetical protein